MRHREYVSHTPKQKRGFSKVILLRLHLLAQIPRDLTALQKEQKSIHSFTFARCQGFSDTFQILIE